MADFEALVGAIAEVHQQLHRQAVKAVNSALTLRNWLIGRYVHEYELGGRDRADYYGEQLLERLAARLGQLGIQRTDARELRRYRLFYQMYPQIWETLSPDLAQALPGGRIGEEIRDSASPESALSGEVILNRLSFTHIRELLAIDDPIKRRFYELQSVKGQWSVRELKRQIATLLFERTGSPATRSHR